MELLNQNLCEISKAFAMYCKMVVEFYYCYFYFNKLTWPSTVYESEESSICAKKGVM